MRSATRCGRSIWTWCRPDHDDDVNDGVDGDDDSDDDGDDAVDDM